jgi:hypothetical protein
MRHWTLNDIVWRAIMSAGIPAVEEPPDLARTDDKRPDGTVPVARRQINHVGCNCGLRTGKFIR